MTFRSSSLDCIVSFFLSGNRIEPVLVDGLTDANPIPRSILEKGYRLLQARAKWYHEFLYAINRFPQIVRDLVSDKDEYQRYRHKIEKMKLRSGTREVGEFLMTLDSDSEQ